MNKDVCSMCNVNLNFFNKTSIKYKNGCLCSKCRTNLMSKGFKLDDILNKLNNNEEFVLVNHEMALKFSPNKIIYIARDNPTVEVIINCDNYKFDMFDLTKIELGNWGSSDVLKIDYLDEKYDNLDKSIYFHLNKVDKFIAINLVYYYNNKIKEKRTGVFRYTSKGTTFWYDRFDKPYKYLRYAYLDIAVAGCAYRDFDISQIELEHPVVFEFEPNNEYDANAIKIKYDNIHIGYIPKGTIQSMLHNYLNDKNNAVKAYITLVSEMDKKIYIAIAFYQGLTEKILNRFEYWDTELIKTTGKTRQNNLAHLYEGCKVDMYYEGETNTYVVQNGISECGEINIHITDEIHTKEIIYPNTVFFGLVTSLQQAQSGKISCSIRIYAIEDGYAP